MARLALFAVSTVVLCGCFTFRSTVAVRPDGSGTITETLALSGPALAMMRSGEAPLSTAEALLARAARLGDGVTLVHTDTLGGVRTTVYSFRTIAAVRYSLPDNATEPADLAAVADVPPLYTFGFERATGRGPAVLRIVTPDAPDEAPAAYDSAAVVQSLAVARVMVGEARATVEVVAEGEPAGDGATTTTLLDLPFGPVLDLVERHPVLAASASIPLEGLRRTLVGTEGITVHPPGTTAIRFH
ncbi:MAG TPA: hypothetical protein VF594_11780 [Rubricoccaceae bacterium]|jgi:hypothetical protein